MPQSTLVVDVTRSDETNQPSHNETLMVEKKKRWPKPTSSSYSLSQKLGKATQLAGLFVILSILTLLQSVFHAAIVKETDQQAVAEIDRYAITVPKGNQQQQRQKQDSDYRRRRLEFVHIPKTGGSSIEKVMAEHDVSWGACKFTKTLRESALNCPSDPQFALSWVQSFPGLLPNVGHPRFPCLAWHMPPYFFDGLLSHEFNPYYNASLFAVVRNPYERMLSEYYYRGLNVLKVKPEKLNSVQRLNEWAVLRLTARVQFVNHSFPWFQEKYCFAEGHFIPQRQFIYRGLDERVVDHVLRFENLHQEFEDLLSLYYGDNHNISLRTSPKVFETNKELTIYNFSAEARQLIELVYAEDFQEFDYPILSSSSS